MRPRLLRTLLAALVCLTAGPASVASAARGGKPKPAATTPISLVSEQVWNSPNSAAPTWCLNEDDYHKRAWSGSLSGAFVAAERLCDSNADYSGGIWWDAGGIGLHADVYVVGTLSDLTLISPDGDAHHAVLIDSATSKGVTTRHYAVCYVPPFSSGSNVGGTPLAGGDWQVALSGEIAKASLTATAQMADVTAQRQYCPASQQNLTP